MRRGNLKRCYQIEKDIEEIDTQLNSWEYSKIIDGSGIIQVRESPLNPKYYKVDLNKIPFKDLRKQALESLNKRRDELEKELFTLLADNEN